MRLLFASGLALGLFYSAHASAQAGGAPPHVEHSVRDVSAGDPSSSCVDTWPKDRARPRFVERFPKRGVSGHVAVLELDIEHLPGETVFPAGLNFNKSAEDAKPITDAEFAVVDRDSEVVPTMKREAADGKVTTSVRLPLIALPSEAGKKELTLPPLAIAVARASGQVHTICSQPHVITVEDPLASVAAPEAKADPEPRVQIEVWTLLRDIVLTLLLALPIAALVAWFLYRMRGKWRKAPPPPPPIPAWEVARSRLAALEARGLLRDGQFEEYLDEVCDALREYLGGRYGFYGLESTTRELLRLLNSRAPDFSEEQDVRTILQRVDLVKFARRIPSEEECEDAMRLIRRIIEKTVPSPVLDPRASTPSDGAQS